MMINIIKYAFEGDDDIFKYKFQTSSNVNLLLGTTNTINVHILNTPWFHKQLLTDFNSSFIFFCLLIIYLLLHIMEFDNFLLFHPT